MKKKLLSVLLTTAMVATLAGCGSSDDAADTSDSTTPEATEVPAADDGADAATDDGADVATDDGADAGLAYTGEINFMHFSTSEESEGNGGSDGFRTCIAEWEAAHPDITLNQEVLANADYKTQIATYAAADSLPDVFLLQGMNSISWANQGLVLDLTDYIT